MMRIPGAACLLFAASLGWGQAPPASLHGLVVTSSARSCPSDDLFSLERPAADEGPTRVGVGAFINDVISIDDVEQSAKIDFYAIFRWRDPRLADPRRGNAAAACPLPFDRLWAPTLEADNVRDRRPLYGDYKMVDGEGTITLVRRQIVDFATRLDVRDFPFDSHRLRVTLKPVYSDESEVVLEPLEGFSGIAETASVGGWRIGTASIAEQRVELKRRGGVFSVWSLELPISRDWQYYAYKMLLPIVLIFLMAGSVFVLPPANVVSQLSIAVTAILTLIAYQFTLAAMLPRVSYFTRADVFVVGTSLLVYLALGKAVLTARLIQQKKESLSKKLDYWGRLVYGALFVVVAGLAFGA